MKITRKILRGLIQETILKESGWEMGVASADPTVLLSFAKAHANLGTAVQEQLDDLAMAYYDGSGADSPEWVEAVFQVNPNAVDVIRRELLGMNEGIDELIEEYDATYNAGDLE